MRDIADQCDADNTIGPKVDAMKGLSLMNKTGASRILVIEHDRLIGVLSLKDMLRFLALKVELEET